MQPGGLNKWIERFSEKPHAQWILFVVAMVEGAIFPLPPDPILITLSVANARKAFVFAAICAAGSIVGSCIGYAVGYAAFESFGRSLVSSIGVLDAMTQALGLLREYGMFALILAGFTPIPFAVFTITAGMNQTLDDGTFALGSIIGRSLRFGLMGLLFFYFGDAAKRFIEQHLGKLSILILFLIIVLIAVARWLL
jgi:membrane protein YqaA with SNARE-associated domain